MLGLVCILRKLLNILMRNNYNVDLSYSDYNSKQNLLSLISSMIKLDSVTENTFQTITNAINERSMKLEHLISRIIRIQNILTHLSSQNIPINFKQSVTFPDDVTQNNSIYYSLFYNDTNIPTEQMKHYETQHLPLYVSNSYEHSIDITNRIEEQIFLMKKALQDSEGIMDISKSLLANGNDVRSNDNGNTRMEEFFPVNDVDYVYSGCKFENKELRKGKKLLVRDNSSDKQGEQVVDSNKFKKREIQDAPISVKEKEKLNKNNEEVNENIRKRFKPKIQINLPRTLKLGNVSDIVIPEIDNVINKENNSNKELNQEVNEQIEVEDEFGNEYDDEHEHEINLPIDYIKDKKKNKSQSPTTITNGDNKQQTTNTVNEVNVKDVNVNNNVNKVETTITVQNNNQPLPKGTIPVPPPLAPNQYVKVDSSSISTMNNLDKPQWTMEEELKVKMSSLSKTGSVKVNLKGK